MLQPVYIHVSVIEVTYSMHVRLRVPDTPVGDLHKHTCTHTNNDPIGHTVLNVCFLTKKEKCTRKPSLLKSNMGMNSQVNIILVKCYSFFFKNCSATTVYIGISWGMSSSHNTISMVCKCLKPLCVKLFPVF